MIPLDTGEEDESVGVLYTVTIPHTNQEGFPVEIDTVVEVVEGALVLVDEVGGDYRSAESEGGGTAFFFCEVDHTTAVDGDFDGDTVDGVESLVGTAEVGTCRTGIPTGTVNHDASAEVGVPFAVVLRRLCGSLVDESL